MRTRFQFHQDGTVFATSGVRLGSSRIAGMEYSFSGMPLSHVVLNLFKNADDTGFQEALDTVEFVWEGPIPLDPFQRPVDLEFTASSDGLDERLDLLRRRYGVRLERVAEQIQYAMVVLTDEPTP